MLSLRSNQRKLPRAPIQAPAVVTVGTEKLEGTLLQIGEGGLFIELKKEPKTAAPISVSFELPGFGPQRATAEIRWSVRPGQLRIAPTAQGVGCRFSSVMPQTKEQISQYVKRMKQTYSQLQFALALNRPTPQFQALLREVKLDGISDLKQLKERVDLVLAQLNVA